MINHVYTVTFKAFARESATAFLVKSGLVIMGTSLLSGWLLARFCPEAAGSGIPQLKLAYWN